MENKNNIDPESIPALMIKLKHWPMETEKDRCPAIRVQINKCISCGSYFLQYYTLYSENIDHYDGYGIHSMDSHTCEKCLSKEVEK